MGVPPPALRQQLRDHPDRTARGSLGGEVGQTREAAHVGGWREVFTA